MDPSPPDIPSPPNMQIRKNRKRAVVGCLQLPKRGEVGTDLASVLHGVPQTERQARPAGKHVGPLSARSHATTEEGTWLPHAKQYREGETLTQGQVARGRRIYPGRDKECTAEWSPQRKMQVGGSFKPSAELPELGYCRKRRTEAPLSVADRRDRRQKEVDHQQRLCVARGHVAPEEAHVSHGSPPLFPRQRAGDPGTQAAVLKWARDGAKDDVQRLQELSKPTRDNVRGILHHTSDLPARRIPSDLAQQAAVQAPYIHTEEKMKTLIPSRNITGSFPQPNVPPKEGCLSGNRLRFLREPSDSRPAWH
eukprot:TRINITY_DN2337_c0_g1_i1.p1 TRINITY_DN2337_c0_g1~~TRINITY_DN2337_c0_g1_i1.p1  ORF type:complete len:346 (+),score=103.47 TRINITY_DN2337_c0_g1_i1:116-1039(+)